MHPSLRNSLVALTLLAALLTLLPAGPAAAEKSASKNGFAALYDDYEAIRLALLADTTDGVAERARALKATAESLAKDFSAETAGVTAEGADEAKTLLPEIATAAGEVAAAEDIKTTRKAFYEVSKPLIRYAALATGDAQPKVAYCPMARKSWLQPDGEIGNPYYGQSMATCGGFVEKK